MVTLTASGGATPIKKPISAEEVLRLDDENRRALYATLRPEQLINPRDYLALLEQGLRDADTVVRRNAAGQTAMALVGLQRLKREGNTLPIDVSRLPALQDTLRQVLNDPDAQVRGAISSALAFSDVANAEIETLLLEQWRREGNAELRVANLKALVDAGYRSDRLNNALVSSLSDGERRVREQASRLTAEVKPPAALPKLAALLADKEMARDFVVDAIASYGPEAGVYLPTLEKLLGDPSVGGTLPERLRRAIEAIRNPQPQAAAAPKVKAVALADAPPAPPQPGAAAPVATTPPPATPAPTASPAASLSPATPAPQTPAPVVERKAPVWPWVAGIIALIAIVSLILKRRA